MTKREITQILEERWPKLFNFNNPKPLKLEIHKDIYSLIDESEQPQYKNALSTYVRRLKYTTCLAKGGERYDLEGNAFGLVTEEEQSLSQVVIDKRNLKIKQKRKNIDQHNEAIKKAKLIAMEKEAESHPKAEAKPQSTPEKLTLPNSTKSTTVVIKKKRRLTL